MLIPDINLDPALANIYSVAAAEKASAAKDAAELRRQLASGAVQPEAELEPSVIVSIDKESEQGSHQPPDQDEPPAHPKQTIADEDSSEPPPPEDQLSIYG